MEDDWKLRDKKKVWKTVEIWKMWKYKNLLCKSYMEKKLWNSVSSIQTCNTVKRWHYRVKLKYKYIENEKNVCVTWVVNFSNFSICFKPCVRLLVWKECRLKKHNGFWMIADGRRIRNLGIDLKFYAVRHKHLFSQSWSSFKLKMLKMWKPHKKEILLWRCTKTT